MKAHSQSLSITASRRQESLLSWIPPPDGWVKINIDGSVIQHTNSAAAGGIIRDGQGRKLEAFAANLGTCSIMRAELRAAEIGLHIVWDLGVRKVILELDSSAALASILGSDSEDTRHGHIIQQICMLRDRQWQVKIQHTYRETNQVADLLAHLGHTQPFGTHFICNFPSDILAALRSDCIGVAFPRLISINS
ncbi:Putative ribonuclease H protein At1g65750 [Linum perenne]